jgi:hypothetical protein
LEYFVGYALAHYLPQLLPLKEKKWAMSILSAAAGGMIGYLVKK